MVYARHGERYEAFERLLQQQEGDPSRMAAVRRACLTMAQVFMDEKGTYLAQQRVIDTSRTLFAYDVRLDAAWYGLISKALGDEEGQPDDVRWRARVLGGATLGLVRAIIREWFDKGGEPDLVAMGRDAFELMRLPTAEEAPQ